MTSPATQEPCPKCGARATSQDTRALLCCEQACPYRSPSQRAELLTREQLDPAAVMLRTGMAALEHARDLRVKVGVSELQAAALLQHIAALQSEVTTAHARADDWHQRASQMLIDLTKAQRSVAALTQRVEAADKLIDRCLELVRGDIEQFGPCDHSVGCCICGEVRLADDIAAYRALSQEPRNG